MFNNKYCTKNSMPNNIYHSTYIYILYVKKKIKSQYLIHIVSEISKYNAAPATARLPFLFAIIIAIIIATPVIATTVVATPVIAAPVIATTVTTIRIAIKIQ